MPVVPSAADREVTERRDSPTRISRTMVNFVLDAALLIGFVTLVGVSFVLRFVFPRPTAAAGWTLWGLGYDNWSNLQFNVLAVFMLGILVHVMLHWTWVCGVITGRLLPRGAKPIRWEDGTRTLAGVGLLLVIFHILGFLMALAALLVRPPS